MSLCMNQSDCFVSMTLTSSFGAKIQWISMAQQCYCVSLASTLWEDDVARFLGVTLEWEPETGLLEMKQTGLITWVIKALGLDDGIVKGKYTPSESIPLVKNLNDEAASGAFSYINVVGILLYLFRHIRPDITFLSIVVLNTCSVLKHLHEFVLKRIGRYLKQTSDHEMVTNPSSNVCKLMKIPMLTLQGCMVVRFTQIPLSARANWIQNHFCRMSYVLAI
jgi:hypothetical protein